jgi:hypothetical protein
MAAAHFLRSGEDRIRTCGRGFGPDNRLAGGPNRPLWHLPYHTFKPGFLSPTRPDELAEGEGFEPPVGCPTAVFKTAALDRSAIPPFCFTGEPSSGAYSTTQEGWMQCFQFFGWLSTFDLFTSFSI